MPKTAQLMATRGIPAIHIEDTCYRNALRAYGPSGQIDESDWAAPAPVDQRTLHEGNSVLRGQEPKVEGPRQES